MFIILNKSGIACGKSELNIKSLLPPGFSCIPINSVWPLLPQISRKSPEELQKEKIFHKNEKPQKFFVENAVQFKARDNWVRSLPAYTNLF